tara:strand:- start:786 stop:1718 length:933 start_codon:yes stop_codon:yes gene_type:complete
MNELKPINQTKLYGLNKFLDKFIRLYNDKEFPNKILLSGQRGVGKSTLAYHFINYLLSKGQKYQYDLDNFEINVENQSYKTILNGSNPNFYNIDINSEKKFIDINQIRELISKLNKSSFNNNPRFVLIDNIEFLNKNSINALLKTLEEPSLDIYFILIHSNKKILSTLLSRCINYKIYLSNKENFNIANKLLNGSLDKIINKDLLNYYSSAGDIYKIAKFAEQNNYDLSNKTLKDLLKIMIKENFYKKNNSVKSLIYDFIELHLSKVNQSIYSPINDKYNYFLKRISDTKRFNLDEDSLFIEFEEELLNE